MPTIRTKKRLAATLTVLAVLLAAGLYAVAQQPYQLTPMDEAKRDRAVAVGGGKYHVLPATLQTTQWGWLDPAEPPKVRHRLGRHGGDRDHDARAQRDPARRDDGRHRQAAPGQPRRRAALDDGPGVDNGAEPGDTLEIRIKKIVPKAFATNFHLPGAQFPTVGSARSRISDGLRPLLLPRPRQEADRVQAGRGHRPAAVPRHHRGRPRPQRAEGKGRAAHQGCQGPHQRRSAPGRTAPTWTSTSCRRARRSTCRSS